MSAAALLLLGALLAAAALPPALDFPHIPWLAVQLAAEPAASGHHRHDCYTASATFLLMLLQAKSKTLNKTIIDDLSGGSEGCVSRLGVSTDENRWPRTLVTVGCACEGRPCRLLGAFQCATLLGKVPVLVRRPGGHGAMLPATQALPVGCHCLERPSKRAHHTNPQVQKRRFTNSSVAGKWA